MELEIPICQCGVAKVEANKSGVFVCMNCDAIQAIEYVEVRPGVYADRVKSPQDIAYHLEMQRRINGWYK